MECRKLEITIADSEDTHLLQLAKQTFDWFFTGKWVAFLFSSSEPLVTIETMLIYKTQNDTLAVSVTAIFLFGSGDKYWGN